MQRLVLGGLVVAAAGVALALWLRADHGRAARPARPTPAVTAPAPLAPRPPTAAPVAPAPAPGPVAPSDPVRIVAPAAPAPAVGSPVGFDDEPRDPAWADDHEHELGLRLRAIEEGLEDRGVTVTIGPPECRRTLCRVALGAPDAGALGKLYGVLESEQGLYGWADTLVLDRVETAADGKVETHVMAQFVRDEP